MLDHNYNHLIPGHLYKTSNKDDIYIDFNIYKKMIDTGDITLTSSLYPTIFSTDIFMYLSPIPQKDYQHYEMNSRGFNDTMIPIYLSMNNRLIIPSTNHTHKSVSLILNEVIPASMTIL